ncbi:MAG: hypothetical protein ABFD82_17145 [Syntrophaceae bacterium]
MYYLIEQIYNGQPTYQLETSASHIKPPLRWIEGKRFKTPPIHPLQLTVRSQPGARMTDFFESDIPLFSTYLLQEFLNGGVDNIDAYPVILKDLETAETWDHFYAVNIIGVIGCADMVSSNYNDFVGNERFSVNFDKLVISPAKCHGQLCFRLYENLAKIIIHRKIVTQISLSNFEGLQLQKLAVSE